MDTVSIAGSSLLYRGEQTQMALSMNIMKTAAAQQNQMVNILAQSSQQIQNLVTKSNDSYNFSTFA